MFGIPNDWFYPPLLLTAKLYVNVDLDGGVSLLAKGANGQSFVVLWVR